MPIYRASKKSDISKRKNNPPAASYSQIIDDRPPMLTPPDLIHLPYTPDLTEGGIAYACRSLPHTYNRMGGSPFDRLRRIVGGVAVELALRRYLGEQSIPFDVQGATPFTDPDRYDVSLGGHRCDLKSYLITRRGQIKQIRRDPGRLLQAQALVPMDQFVPESHNQQDLYLFAFLTGLITPSQADLHKAIASGQPLYLIHPLPKEWARPQVWQPLGTLALKGEADQVLTVEVGGQDQARDFLTETVTLSPRTRVELQSEFYALDYLHVNLLPQGRLGLHCPARDEIYLIAPLEWGNIWVYGMDLLLTGYLTRDEFRRRSEVVPVGSRVYQYSRTRTKNLAVPVADLKPLGELFDRVREWEARKD
jgi:hypothetical protein